MNAEMPHRKHQTIFNKSGTFVTYYFNTADSQFHLHHISM